MKMKIFHKNESCLFCSASLHNRNVFCNWNQRVQYKNAILSLLKLFVYQPVSDIVHLDCSEFEGEVMGEHVLEEPLGGELLDWDPHRVASNKVVGKGGSEWRVVAGELVKES